MNMATMELMTSGPMETPKAELILLGSSCSTKPDKVPKRKKEIRNIFSLNSLQKMA
jgi:hypothetical protein